MNMTGPAYRSGGKRIPVARPPRRSDPETSTGSASAPDALPGTNRKTMTDSEKASVSSVSAGAPAPARQEKASSTLYPKALKSLEKRIRGYLLKEVKTTYEYDGDGNKRIKNETITRKQVAPTWRRSHSRCRTSIRNDGAQNPLPTRAVLRTTTLRTTTVPTCRDCPNRRSVKFRDCRNSDEPVVPVRNLLRSTTESDSGKMETAPVTFRLNHTDLCCFQNDRQRRNSPAARYAISRGSASRAIRLTPFHRTYYNTLDRFAHGQIRRLIVSVPPQHGKSLGSSVLLPAYLLGIAPQTRIALGLVQPAARVPLQPPGTTFDERTRLPGRFPRDTAQDVLRKTTERDPHERRIRTDRRSGAVCSASGAKER